MTEVFAHEQFNNDEPGIFLAGPSPRSEEAYNWRKDALDYMHKKKFNGVVFIPLPRDGNWLSDYDAQIDWEIKYLNKANVIAFWIPRDLVTMPAFTTNVEFGMFVKSGKIVLGYPEGAPKMRYLHYLANMNSVPVFKTMEKTLDYAIQVADKK